MKRYEEALEDYSKVIEIDSKNGKVYFDRAMVYDILCKYAVAIKDYTKCLELNYLDVPGVWFGNRAKCYYKLEKYEEAINEYTEAIGCDASIDKYYPHDFIRRARCYERLCKY